MVTISCCAQSSILQKITFVTALAAFFHICAPVLTLADVRIDASTARTNTYAQYQRYRLSISNDYSSIADKKTVIEIARQNPNWNKNQILQELQKHQTAQRALLKTLNNGYEVPRSVSELGDMTVGLAGIATGVLVAPLWGTAATTIGGYLTKSGIRLYESWASPEARLEASQKLYDARMQGYQFVDQVNKAAAELRAKNPRAAEIIDQIDNVALGITMGTRTRDILTKDPTFANIELNKKIYRGLSPDGSLAVKTDDIKQLGSDALAAINLMAREEAKRRNASVDREARAQILASTESAIYIIGNILKLDQSTREFARYFEMTAQAAVTFYKMAERYNDAATVAPGSYSSSMVTLDFIAFFWNFAVAISTIDDPGPEQVILDSITDLRTSIYQLHKDMSERFDRVDLQLNRIWETMLKEFARVERAGRETAAALANIRQDLTLLSDRVGKIQERLLDTIAQTQIYMQLERVDIIVNASKDTVQYPDNEKAALGLASFARAAINSPPFVVNNDFFQSMSDEEKFSALTGIYDSVKRSNVGKLGNLGSDDLNNIGRSINILQQYALGNNALAPALANPAGFTFAVEQLIRLADTNPAFAKKLPPAVKKQFVDVGTALQLSIKLMYGTAPVGPNGTSEIGRKLLAKALQEYKAAAEGLISLIDGMMQQYASSNIEDVRFWDSIDGMYKQENIRPAINFPSSVQYCNYFDDSNHLGTLSRFEMALPQDVYTIIDPTFRLANRLGLLSLSYCHYTNQEAWLDRHAYYRFAVISEGKSIVTQSLRSAVPMNPQQAANLWPDYKPRFTKESKFDEFPWISKAAEMFPGHPLRGTHNWVRNCRSLIVRPSADSPCHSWEADLKVDWKSGVPNEFQELGTSLYQREEFRKVIEERVQARVQQTRLKFRAFILQQLVGGDIARQLRELTWRKYLLLALINLGYADALDSNDDLRGVFFGSEQLFDEFSLPYHVENDGTFSGRLLLLPVEMQKRIDAAMKAVTQIKTKPALVPIDNAIARLRSVLN